MERVEIRRKQTNTGFNADSMWERKGRGKPLLVTSVDFQGKRSEVEAFLELAANCQADSELDRSFTR